MRTNSSNKNLEVKSVATHGNEAYLKTEMEVDGTGIVPV